MRASPLAGSYDQRAAEHDLKREPKRTRSVQPEEKAEKIFYCCLQIASKKVQRRQRQAFLRGAQ